MSLAQWGNTPGTQDLQLRHRQARNRLAPRQVSPVLTRLGPEDNTSPARWPSSMANLCHPPERQNFRPGSTLDRMLPLARSCRKRSPPMCTSCQTEYSWDRTLASVGIFPSSRRCSRYSWLLCSGRSTQWCRMLSKALGRKAEAGGAHSREESTKANRLVA